MTTSLNTCYICGESNPVVIEEHHKLPRRYGGPDSEVNTILLCANCHRALESAYDNQFWEFAFQQLRWQGEIEGEVPDIPEMEREMENEILKQFRYDLVIALRKEEKTHREICEFLDEMETLQSLSQQRVSQLINAESFEDAYATNGQ